MRHIKAVTAGLLLAFILSGCGSLQPGENRAVSPASSDQGIVRTQLEQALFNEIVLRFAAAHPGPIDPIDYQKLLNELEQTVALTEITSLQQQTLKAVRRSVAGVSTATLTPALDAWVGQELSALRRIRTALGTADPGLFQVVGPAPEARQQFLGLIEASIETHRALNPLGLRFSDLPPLLVKPYLLAAETAFFYQPDDASIRITDASFNDLSFPEAEVIALINGLPGSHFLFHQTGSRLFADTQTENQKAMAILLLATMGHVEFYQTAYSQIARIDFLTLSLARYQKAARPSQSFEQFMASIGSTHYGSERLLQAYNGAGAAPRTLILQGRALRSLSASTGLSISAAQAAQAPLTEFQRKALLSHLTRLGWPLDPPSKSTDPS